MATTKASGDVDAGKLGIEPNWLTGDLGNYSALVVEKLYLNEEHIYQQSDLIKPMMDDIVKFGLNYTYQKFKGDKVPKKYSKTKNKKHVIVVGAGAAGLSAAYELTKVGHEVSIVEMQNRVGGRIKTLREKDGFSKYCYTEAGAMRLPKRPDDPDKTHYLTDYYAAKEFKLGLAPYKNYDENAYLKFYDKKNIKISDWKEHSTEYCNEFWKGWDSRIQETKKVQVKDIADYYEQTTNIVADQLKNKLNSIQSEDPRERQTEMARIWNQWINNWCKFSLVSLLQNTKDGVQQLLDDDHKLHGDAADKLDALIPWPDIAIVAYSAYTYTLELDLSLIIYLRESLGKWWEPHMHCIADGMHRLPKAFITKRKSPWPHDPKIINLEKETTYHIKVEEVVYTAEDQNDFQSLKVTVKGIYVSSGQPFEIKGDAVIITVPPHIIRQIRFVAGSNTNPPEMITKIQRSLDDIFQAPSTKVMLQYKERFWEKEGIHGGFSKTTMPIGQLHYPTVDKDTEKTKKGILMSYTWKSEATMFAALTPDGAVREAVSEVARLHPDSAKLFEVGVVQAWSNEPYSQGAFALLKPHQYLNIRFLMNNPCLNMFFAGDGLSFAVGWIQGALESGLRAAYQFYCRNEHSSHHQ